MSAFPAIPAAFDRPRAGEVDVLVVAGKGHETGQTAQGRTLPFDDTQVARDATMAADARTGGEA